MSFSTSRSFRMVTGKNSPTWLLGSFNEISTDSDLCQRSILRAIESPGVNCVMMKRPGGPARGVEPVRSSLRRSRSRAWPLTGTGRSRSRAWPSAGTGRSRPSLWSSASTARGRAPARRRVRGGLSVGRAAPQRKPASTINGRSAIMAATASLSPIS